MTQKNDEKYQELTRKLVDLGSSTIPKSLTKQVASLTVSLLSELDSIDEQVWVLEGGEPLPSNSIPEINRWHYAIGETDINGNFILPAELFSNSKLEIERIKIERQIYSKIRNLTVNRHHEDANIKPGNPMMIVSKKINDLENKANQYHRTDQEIQRLSENLKWAKQFNLTMREISDVLGEKEDYLNKLSVQIKRCD